MTIESRESAPHALGENREEVIKGFNQLLFCQDCREDIDPLNAEVLLEHVGGHGLMVTYVCPECFQKRKEMTGLKDTLTFPDVLRAIKRMWGRGR